MPYYTRSNPPPLSGIALRLRKKHIESYMVHHKLDFMWEKTTNFIGKVAKMMYENKGLTMTQAINAVAEKHSS